MQSALKPNVFTKVFSHSFRNLSTVTVVGCGLMGSGIAQVAAENGFKVNLVDLNQNLLDKALSLIKVSAERVAKKKFKDEAQFKPYISNIISNINLSTNGLECAKKSDLIIEAIAENLPIKQKLFGELDAVAPPSCLFATNTSSLSVADVAKGVKRLDKFGGLHFFNPVPVMKLVEVVRIAQTSDDTFKEITNFAQKLGKTTVSCKDTPGFIVNRLLIPYSLEAVRMAERGDASPEDIDTAMKLGAGYLLGPFELADMVGLDLNKMIMDGWGAKFPDDPRMQTPPSLIELANKGHLGRKSGQGFYKYDSKGKRISDTKK